MGRKHLYIKAFERKFHIFQKYYEDHRIYLAETMILEKKYQV